MSKRHLRTSSSPLADDCFFVIDSCTKIEVGRGVSWLDPSEAQVRVVELERVPSRWPGNGILYLCAGNDRTLHIDDRRPLKQSSHATVLDSAVVIIPKWRRPNHFRAALYLTAPWWSSPSDVASTIPGQLYTWWCRFDWCVRIVPRGTIRLFQSGSVLDSIIYAVLHELGERTVALLELLMWSTTSAWKLHIGVVMVRIWYQRVCRQIVPYEVQS